MKLIPLNSPGGYSAIVDDEDYDYLSQFRWRLYRNKARYVLYAQTWIGIRAKRVAVRMHQLICPATSSGSYTDHINGDGLDNRRANLRRVTNSQNRMNQHAAHYHDGLKGICWRTRDQVWSAIIRINGKQHWLGQFHTKEAAARAYDAAARELFGEYARCNFT